MGACGDSQSISRLAPPETLQETIAPDTNVVQPVRPHGQTHHVMVQSHDDNWPIQCLSASSREGRGRK